MKHLAVMVVALALPFGNVARAEKVLLLPPADGGAAQYYPGQGVPVPPADKPALQRYIADNRPAIADISEKIKQIKAGTLALGCIGRDAHTCAASLAQVLAVGDSYKNPALLRQGRVDVNGNGLIDDIVLRGFLPNRAQPGPEDGMDMVLKLDVQRRVGEMAILLRHDPTAARTAEEYDATGLYETVGTILHDRCPGLARLELYRFFENTVKPQAIFIAERHYSLPFRTGFNAEGRGTTLDYCDHHLQFLSLRGRETERKREHGKLFDVMYVIIR